VFFKNFTPERRPDFGSVLDGLIFNQETSDRAAEIVEEMKDGGLWEERGEMQNVPTADSRTGNQVVYNIVEYAKGEDVPKRFFDDAQHGFISKMVRGMAVNGRVTRENAGMGIFRNAFTSAFAGGDGVELVDASHPLLAGGTQSNLVTGVLSPDSLEEAIVKLAEQKSQAGVIMGVMPKVLLVPSALYREAVQITESKLEAGTANNDMNVYSTKYGITVKQSPYLGASAGGSDSKWFLLGEQHGLTRYEREGITTTLVDWKASRNNSYFYKAMFREATGWSTHIGVVGSNATT
jgi:hypothetical protein